MSSSSHRQASRLRGVTAAWVGDHQEAQVQVRIWETMAVLHTADPVWNEEASVEMPVVSECKVEACSYNREGACHALAITVGNALRAHCDTYFHTSFKGGDPAAIGHVGACKMSDCAHNTDLECQAPGIVVGLRQDEADCLTYTPR